MTAHEVLELLEVGMLFVVFFMALMGLKKPKWVIKEIVKELNELQLNRKD